MKGDCTSMTERGTLTGIFATPTELPQRRSEERGSTTAIVPRDSISGRSLTAVVAIMTFLAALTAGAVMMVVNAAGDWQAEVGREITVQVRPVPGRDIEADVNKAVALARTAPGVVAVRPYSREDSAQLVEPWLGTGLALDELPMPRMIVVTLGPACRPISARCANRSPAHVPSATLDDHRGWIDRMRAMAEARLPPASPCSRWWSRSRCCR